MKEEEVAKEVLEKAYENAKDGIFYSEAAKGCNLTYSHLDEQERYFVKIEIEKITDETRLYELRQRLENTLGENKS